MMSVGKLLPIILILCIIRNAHLCGYIETKGSKFPSNFSLGVATASYQIEGGWNADGKGPSIWDTFTHQHPEKIADNSNGDEATDSYNLFELDLAALKYLKVDHYRFSIAWTRIFPNGDNSTFNQKGVDYYNMVIDKLLKNGITPVVTMYHYDLPDELSKLGGLTNPIFQNYFVAYADILFKFFGDRVKTWITFNEPYDYCMPGYGSGSDPPGVHKPGVADYLCMDTTLKSHALVYRMYRNKYYSQFKGRIGITVSSRFFFSHSKNINVVDRGLQYVLGFLVHPIYSKTGGYPEVMVEEIASNSLKEHLPWSRLPQLDDNWRKIVHGAGDFFGLNYYTSRYLEEANPPEGDNPSYERDARQKTSVDASWKRAKSSWLYCVPQGLEELLKYIRDEYNNVEVIITENGWSDDGELSDEGRIQYLQSHLQAVLNAIEDGCNVTGYTVWSLIDNFEWLRGYTEKFGLYHVDFKSAKKERIPKLSANFYKKLIEDRVIPTNIEHLRMETNAV